MLRAKMTVADEFNPRRSLLVLYFFKCSRVTHSIYKVTCKWKSLSNWSKVQCKTDYL